MKQLLMGCLCLVLLAGCSSASRKEVNQPQGNEVVESTITVIDQSGREVSLDGIAETVASGYYISTTALIGMGQADKLVGVEMKPETRLIYKEAAPQILELPQLGNKKSFNVEECAKADPDVVFLPVALEGYVDELEALEIPVILLEPETQKGYREMLEIMGTVLGCSDRIERYLEYEAMIEEKFKVENAEEPTVYFAGNDVLSGAVSGMFQNEIIEYAKANNILNIEGKKWAEINVETLIEANPDVIFVENGSLTVESFTEDERFHDLKAVQNEQVYLFPSALETWDTPGLSSILGKIYAAAVINPDKIEMSSVIEEAKNFYQEFFGFDASEYFVGL